LKDRFPGVTLKETKHLGGTTWAICIWNFIIMVTLNDTSLDASGVHPAGALGSASFVFLLCAAGNRGDTKLHKVTTQDADDLHEAADWVVKYLTGVAAGIETAFEKPQEKQGIYDEE
jgi:hypothetical protein